jgi:hypothetical protein
VGLSVFRLKQLDKVLQRSGYTISFVRVWNDIKRELIVVLKVMIADRRTACNQVAILLI